MPDYGSIEYWDNRYSDDSEPFDWLFGFQELEPIIGQVSPISLDLFFVFYPCVWYIYIDTHSKSILTAQIYFVKIASFEGSRDSRDWLWECSFLT